MTSSYRTVSKQRQSNYEVLRIISMFLIVAHHYPLHTGVPGDTSPPLRLSNEIISNFIHSGGKIGVNLFMLLTGYFLKGRNIKSKALVRTWAQTFMWSSILFLVYWFRRPMWYEDYKRNLLPVTEYAYWYVSCYMVVMTLSPAIACTASLTSDGQLITILASLFAIMCLFSWSDFTAYCHIQWLVFVALLGASIRRYEPQLKPITLRRCLWVLFFLSIVSIVGIAYFTTHPECAYAQRYGGYALTFDIRQPFSLFIALAGFLVTQRVRIESELVNTFAKCTFGVYLIHENNFLKYNIWYSFMRIQEIPDNYLFPFYSFIVICSVYLGCSGLEFLRQMLLGGVEEFLVNKVDGLLHYAERICNSFLLCEDEKS